MIVDKYQLTIEENVFLAKRNIVDSIYKESRLEGIVITFPETNEIYEGRAVAGMSVDDIVKVNNLKHAWQFIRKNKQVDIFPSSITCVNSDNLRKLNGIVRLTV